MSSNKENLLARLQALRDDYIRDYPERTRQLRQSWEQYQKHADPEILTTFHRQAHSLKGSGATYQFDDISTHAGQLDNITSSMIENSSRLTDPEAKQIEILVSRLCDLELQTGQAYSSAATTTEDEELAQTLLLISNNTNLCQDLEKQLSSFDFKLRVASNLEKFDSLVSEHKPSAIILQIQFEDGTSGLDAVHDYLSKHGKNLTPPVIYISNTDDIDTRIKSVRNNGIKFLQHPIEPAGI